MYVSHTGNQSKIREFIQQRMQIKDQSARLWYKTNDLGNLQDPWIIMPKWNAVDNMIIQIKYLTDSTPLPHVILREEINYSLEANQPLEQKLVKYKDQIYQT